MNTLLLYIGQSMEGFLYKEIEDLTLNNGHSLFGRNCHTSRNFKNKLGNTKIGGIYEYNSEKNEAGTVIITFNKKSADLKEYWKNSADISIWRESERLFKLSKIKDLEISSLNIEKLLQPISDLYRSSKRDERTLLIADIIRIITK